MSDYGGCERISLLLNTKKPWSENVKQVWEIENERKCVGRVWASSWTFSDQLGAMSSAASVVIFFGSYDVFLANWKTLLFLAHTNKCNRQTLWYFTLRQNLSYCQSRVRPTNQIHQMCVFLRLPVSISSNLSHSGFIFLLCEKKTMLLK